MKKCFEIVLRRYFYAKMIAPPPMIIRVKGFAMDIERHFLDLFSTSNDRKEERQKSDANWAELF